MMPTSEHGGNGALGAGLEEPNGGRQRSAWRSREVLTALRLAMSRHGFYMALSCILVLAAIMRLYHLAEFPQRFNQDEMTLGYDAWSVWQTGHDRHGAFLPIYFETFGDYVPPVANYVAAPFVGILGLSEFTTRLPFALLGIATVWLVALLGRRWFTPSVGLGAALLLSLDPWHVNYSRIAFPASLLPFFTTLALYSFTRGLDAADKCLGHNRIVTTGWCRASMGWLLLSGASFALLTGSYPTMKVEAPLLVGACILAAWRTLRRHLSLLLVWLGSYAIITSPLAVAQLMNWAQIQGRYNSMSILGYAHWPILFLTQYIEHFNPVIWFVQGLPGGVAVLGPATGELFWLELPLAIIAFAPLRRSLLPKIKTPNIRVLLMIWLITFPIASSLTTQDVPHEIRTYNLLPLPELLAAYGAWVTYRYLGDYRIRSLSAAHVALTVGSLGLAVYSLLFVRTFFAGPLLETSVSPDNLPYNVGLQPALDAITQRAGPCDTIWLQPGIQPTMYFLFLTHYPPEQLLNPDLPGSMRTPFRQVLVGMPDPSRAREVLPGECAHVPSRMYFADRTLQVDGNWQTLTTVSNSRGVPVWRALVAPAP